MKKYSILLLTLILSLSGCYIYFEGVSGSGVLVSSSYYETGFTAVDINDAAQVNITYGNSYSVSLFCDDNLVPYVDIYNDGYTLYVNMLGGYSYLNGIFRVDITMPVLTSLDIDEASSVQVSGFDLNGNLNVYSSGASDVDIYLTDVFSLYIDADEASNVEVHSVYAVEELDLYCSGASYVDLEGMMCLYGQIDISDASTVTMNMIVSGNCSYGLSGSVSGASSLFYRGPYTPGPLVFTESSSLIYY